MRYVLMAVLFVYFFINNSQSLTTVLFSTLKEPKRFINKYGYFSIMQNNKLYLYRYFILLKF